MDVIGAAVVVGPADQRVLLAVAHLSTFGADKSVSAIAFSVNLSESRLAHLFRTQFGVSIRAFRSHLHLHRAAALLATQGGPIKEAQYAAEYCDASTFNHAFRMHFNCSPTQFRDRSRRRRDLHAQQDKPSDCRCDSQSLRVISALI